ncbi:hypothetical protein ACQBAU_05575 [Propionibacteriaceae bacterium Y2011]
MHTANHYYGHAHVMAQYAGLAEVPRIWGYLQHGWNTVDGYAVGHQFTDGFTKLVWSEACARRGWQLGLRDYMVVGAPFAYLLEMERQREWLASSPRREGTIVYPFHGWEQQHVLGSHAHYIEELRAVEGDVPITVCLYWNEYRQDHVRKVYEQAGFRVITHGYRGFMWKGTDTQFLHKQLAELRRHSRVVSNRISTAIFYGAATGADVGIYGDPMLLEAERAQLGGPAKPLRLWPELHTPHIPRNLAAQQARLELGTDELLSPAEIRQAFGWQHALRSERGEGLETSPTGDSLSEDSSAPPATLPTDDQAAQLEETTA